MLLSPIFKGLHKIRTSAKVEMPLLRATGIPTMTYQHLRNGLRFLAMLPKPIPALLLHLQPHPTPRAGPMTSQIAPLKFVPHFFFSLAASFPSFASKRSGGLLNGCLGLLPGYSLLTYTLFRPLHLHLPQMMASMKSPTDLEEETVVTVDVDVEDTTGDEVDTVEMVEDVVGEVHVVAKVVDEVRITRLQWTGVEVWCNGNNL